MDFEIPEKLANYLQELDDFIETTIKPIEQQDDNIRFFDHRREDARTDWERGGLPNEEWEGLLFKVKRLADEAGHYRFAQPKEFGGKEDLRYAAEYITSQSDEVTLMIGVDTTVVHGFVNCGAGGAITGIGNALPKEVLHLVALSQKAATGNAAARVKANELDEALGVLSSFDEGADLVLYYKHLMVLNGDSEYELHFNETDKLSDAQRNYVEQQYALFRAWYKDWSQQPDVLALND